MLSSLGRITIDRNIVYLWQWKLAVMYIKRVSSNTRITEDLCWQVTLCPFQVSIDHSALIFLVICLRNFLDVTMHVVR